MKLPKDYNENITLVRVIESHAQAATMNLSEDEWFVVMVEDQYNARYHKRSKSDYWDYEAGYIGLECTSKPNKIYIAKNITHRWSQDCGPTFLVKVKNPDLCRILDY